MFNLVNSNLSCAAELSKQRGKNIALTYDSASKNYCPAPKSNVDSFVKTRCVVNSNKIGFGDSLRNPTKIICPAHEIIQAVSVNFLRGTNLNEYLKKQNKQYVGTMPAFFKKFGSTSKILESLDNLAELIAQRKHFQQLDNDSLIARLTGRSEAPEWFSAKLGKKEIKFKYIKDGTFGEVFHLKVDNNDYALKVFKQKPVSSDGIELPLKPELSHGKWSETAAFLECQNAKVKDVPEFYVGNPMAPQGWYLTEFIPSQGYKTTKQGPLLKDFLEQKGLIASDNINTKANNVSGMQVDLGGIREKRFGYMDQNGMS